MSERDTKQALCRLLYTSFRNHVGYGALDPTDHQIAEQSVKRNKAAGITGSLLVIEDQFIQILEGPPQSVEHTFERICCDTRHNSLKLIDLVDVKERIFPEWSMAGIANDRETRLTLKDEIDEVRFLVGVNASEAVRQMRALLDYEQAHRI